MFKEAKLVVFATTFHFFISATPRATIFPVCSSPCALFGLQVDGMGREPLGDFVL